MKTKLAIGIGLAVLLLVAGQYFLLPGWYREQPGVQTFGWLSMLSIAMGIALSVWLLNYVIQKLLDGKPFDLFGLSATARNGSKIGSYLAGIASYPFALFVGFVMGGSLGGGWGEVLLGKAGVTIGIGMGVFIATTVIAMIAVLVGFVLGGVTEKLTKRLHA